MDGDQIDEILTQVETTHENVANGSTYDTEKDYQDDPSLTFSWDAGGLQKNIQATVLDYGADHMVYIEANAWKDDPVSATETRRRWEQRSVGMLSYDDDSLREGIELAYDQIAQIQDESDLTQQYIIQDRDQPASD